MFIDFRISSKYFSILIYSTSLWTYHTFPIFKVKTKFQTRMGYFSHIIGEWFIMSTYLMALETFRLLLFVRKQCLGASLVAQWLGICLPMQGTRVRALVWEDPTCHGATRPVSHNCWACASGACAPRRERPRWWEARAPRWGVAPACGNWRGPSHRNEDPTQP